VSEYYLFTLKERKKTAVTLVMRRLGHLKCKDNSDWVKSWRMHVDGTDHKWDVWRPGGVVSRKIWKVLACPFRTSGEGRSRGNWL